MKTTNKNTQSGNQPSRTSKLSWIGLTLTMAVGCGLAVSGLSTYSVAQAQTVPPEAHMDQARWVQIPGELIRPDCVHAVPKGAMVEVADDGHITGDVTLNGSLIAHYDPCPEKPVITRPSAGTESAAVPAGNGWVEDSQWGLPLSSSDNIDFMSSTWTVPSYPLEEGASIYIFNGIEPQGGAWILQPVLQYGTSRAGGGNYWAIASWLVQGDDYAFHSPLETVYPGDSIFGYTEMTAASGSTPYWTVVAKDETRGTYSWIKTHKVSGQHWTWAYAAVLEAYNVTSCSQFPANGKVTFYNATVDHGFPYYDVESGNGWVGIIHGYGGPSCDFLVIASEESTLRF